MAYLQILVACLGAYDPTLLGRMGFTVHLVACDGAPPQWQRDVSVDFCTAERPCEAGEMGTCCPALVLLPLSSREPIVFDQA